MIKNIMTLQRKNLMMKNIMTLQRKIIMIMKMLPLHSLRILPKKTIWMFQNTIRLKLILKRRDGPNLKINIE